MDLVSQIQGEIVDVTRLMTQSLEKVGDTPLSPAQAAALTALAEGQEAKVAQSTTKPVGNTKTVTLDDWVKEEQGTIELSQDIFQRLADIDKLLGALPMDMAAEEEQLREIAELKNIQDAAEARLRLAETDAVHCQQLLRGVVRDVGNDARPVEVARGGSSGVESAGAGAAAGGSTAGA